MLTTGPIRTHKYNLQEENNWEEETEQKISNAIG